MKRSELICYLDQLLQPALFQDYTPNGLQVEGCADIKKIITGVTACQALLDAAVAKNADAVLVHHGYFWQGENPNIVGMKRNRLKTLLMHDINLIAYHLPLDAHAEFGNNVRLAKQLDLTIEAEIGLGSGPHIALRGTLSQPMTGEAFAKHVAAKLNREPLFISAGERPIKSVAWCSGAAQDFIELAASEKVDAYLTGEVSERTVHAARELGLHFYAAGHHATELFGIKALGEHLAESFQVDCEFINIDNPV